MLPDAGRSLLRGQDPLLPEGHHLRRRDGRLHFQLRKPPPVSLKACNLDGPSLIALPFDNNVYVMSGSLDKAVY